MWHVYHETKAVQAVVGNIVVVGTLTCYVLLYSVCDLKAAWINMPYSLIQELILYEFNLSHDAVEENQKTFMVQNLEIQLISVL